MPPVPDGTKPLGAQHRSSAVGRRWANRKTGAALPYGLENFYYMLKIFGAKESINYFFFVTKLKFRLPRCQGRRPLAPDGPILVPPVPVPGALGAWHWHMEPSGSGSYFCWRQLHPLSGTAAAPGVAERSVSL